MDKDSVPSANTGVLKVLRVKRQGDSYPYLTQIATADARSEAFEDTRATHIEAAKIGEKDWVRILSCLLEFHAEFHRIPVFRSGPAKGAQVGARGFRCAGESVGASRASSRAHS